MKKIFYIILGPSLMIVLSFKANAISITDLEAEKNNYISSQSVHYIPIMVSDLIIIIPGGEGMPPWNDNQTIAGIDSDGDGIRDDVERRISQSFPNDPLARAYSYMMAKRLQIFIDNGYDEFSVKKAIQELAYIDDCFDKTISSDNTKGSNMVLPWVMNTYSRSKIYIKSLGLLGGEILPEIQECQ